MRETPMASNTRVSPEEYVSKVCDAISKSDWTHAVNLLFKCDRHVEDSVVTQLVNNGLWEAVGHITRIAGDEDRTWNIGGILVKNAVLISIANKDWKFIEKQTSHDSRIYPWIIQQACQKDIISFALPHCADDQLDCVLTTLVERRMWQAVAVLLKRGVSESCKQAAVQEAEREVLQLVNKDEWNTVSHIITCFGELQRTWKIGGISLESEVLFSVANNDWSIFRKRPDEQFPSETFVWIFEHACGRVKESKIIESVLSHCSVDQRDLALTTLVERGLWQAVADVLDSGVSDSQRQWAVQEACRHIRKDDDWFIIRRILLPCPDDQLDSVLTTLVERGLWDAVPVMLDRGVSDSWKHWAVKEACKHVSEINNQSIIIRIVSHCADDQLDSVLTTLVHQGLWQAVKYMMHRNVSDSKKQWAEQEKNKAETEQVSRESVGIFKTPMSCSGSVKGRWHIIKENDFILILDKSFGFIEDSHFNPLSNASFRWFLKELCCRADEGQIIFNVLPNIVEDKLDFALTTLVEQNMWQAVADMLMRGISDSQKQWAVQEACKHVRNTNDKFIIQSILPHCAVDKLDSVLTTLVERSLWQAVAAVLDIGICCSRKEWAVQEAEKAVLHLVSTNQWDAVPHFIRIVGDEHRTWNMGSISVQNNVLLCVANKDWTCIKETSHGRFSHSTFQWIVQQACVQVTEGEIIHTLLPHCAEDRLDCVLTTLVERGLWQVVAHMLNRGVSKEYDRWAVEKACKKAPNDSFVKYIAPCCPDRFLHIVLNILVRQAKVTAVDAVMLQQLRNVKAEHPFIPRWYVGVLPSFVEHGLWNHVKQILHCVIMNSLVYWVKREEIEDDSVVWKMVNMCRSNARRAIKLFKVIKEETASKVQEFQGHVGMSKDLCEVLYTSVLDQVCVTLCSDNENTETSSNSIQTFVSNVYTEFVQYTDNISTESIGEIACHFNRMKNARSALQKQSSSHVQLFLTFVQHFNLYYRERTGWDNDDALLQMFAVLPLVPQLQSVALRIMLRHKRWDVISHADLSGVWEQDRRHLLRAAVKQRQWAVVRGWADHTLYDDHRAWALNEAFNDQQWDMALLLADHGLTDIDLMRVHYRLAKYADWNVILRMFERGADVSEVRLRLGRMKDNKRILEETQSDILKRHSQMREFERGLEKAENLKTYDTDQCTA